MKSSKTAAAAAAPEMTALPSPTTESNPIAKSKSNTENSLANISESSPAQQQESASPSQTIADDLATAKHPPIGQHKMSVPLVSAPSVTAGRSRLSSFNLPLFNTASKPISFFSAHKRRGSLGKSLQKNSKSAGKTGNADETVIDMEEQPKPEKLGEVPDGQKDSAAIDKETLDDFGSGVGVGSLVSPLDRSQSSPKKRGRQLSESSAAKVSVTDERQSKVSLTESGHKATAPVIPRQRSCDHATPDDAADLQRTERGLLTLLDDFNAGRLKAFGSSDASEALRRVREMQERMARSHFDMYALQEKIGFDNPKLASLSLSGWQSLMAGMQELSEAVHRLGTASKVSQTAESQGHPSNGDAVLNNQPEMNGFVI